MKPTYTRLALLLALALLALALLMSACTGTESGGDTEPDTVPASDTTPDTAGTTDETASETDETASETDETASETEWETITLVTPDATKFPDMAVTDNGYDIYKRLRGNEYGYRYGCTYLYNEDGSVDAYFACMGIVNQMLKMEEWDWISYRHSPDGGKTWEPERIVLTPTNGSQDAYSLCDPGVVYFGGYYYLAYTSTMNSLGKCNNLYVARSKNPDGPFEKWNGEGWGGYDPQPILYYDESYEAFGIGEPSFVELNGTLYLYYTHIGPEVDATMVATADATNENWPLTLREHGAAVRKTTDSLDVKYVEEWGKFIAVSTGDRMLASSWLALYESNDGLTFELVDVVREGTYTHLHNAGVSSRPNGHIRISEDADKLCVVYAYGDGWGTWNTRVQPISLSLSATENDLYAERLKSCLPDENLRDEVLPVGERHVAMLRTDRDVYTYTTDTKAFLIKLYAFDAYYERTELQRSTKGVEFIVYDESVIIIDDFRATIKGEGTTAVEVHYAGCKQLFYVTVKASGITSDGSLVTSIEPIHDTYTIYLGEASLHRPQLRVALRYGDGRYAEALVEDNGPALTFADYDKSIISVDAKGLVTALKVGETNVTLTLGNKSCTVKVKVTDNESDAFYGLPPQEEIVYDNLDFSKPGTEAAFSSVVNSYTGYDAEHEAFKLLVTQEDPQFSIAFPDGFMTEDYTKLEITYMAPSSNSSGAQSRGMQIFYCVGSMSVVDEAHSTVRSLVSDGEFHTMTIDLTKLPDWQGRLLSLRIDYINIAAAGDAFYLKSVRLS